jgi:GT2 family glycosyltransferase
VALLPPLDPQSAGRSLCQASRAHLRRRGSPVKVTTAAGALFPAVHVARGTEGMRASIIIPTRNRGDLLRRCIESIAPGLERSGGEVIVVDNDSSDPDTLQYLDEIDGTAAKVIRVDGAFNYARLNNVAAATAQTEYLCLLNNDVEAMEDGWLEEMMGRLAGPDVGAVGALLLWPSGVVQHGGIVLGPSFAAAHAFNDRTEQDPGYADLLRVAHECSAVTAACMLTRRADYLAAGGMDEIRFPVNYNDVDFCLKLRAAGKRIVFTPHARLLHRESASRGSDDRPDRKARYFRELQSLRARWAEVLNEDPYYSPVLSLDSIPFSALAWPPRAMTPRSCSARKPVDMPFGL